MKKEYISISDKAYLLFDRIGSDRILLLTYSDR